MTEKDGKTYFSADFMAKLERILGRDVFKAADFKLNRDGSVSSGKPLTQRRIQAIVEKAGIYANTGFSVGAYRQKLESIKKDLGIAGLSGAQLDALNKNEKTPPPLPHLHAQVSCCAWAQSRRKRRIQKMRGRHSPSQKLW
jgi:hypothetical protein